MRRCRMIRTLCGLTMPCNRPATRCAVWITVILDLLQVTGQVLLDMLAWDWSSAKKLVGRHTRGRNTTSVPSNRSQAVTLPLRPLPRGPAASGIVEATHTRCWPFHFIDTRAAIATAMMVVDQPCRLRRRRMALRCCASCGADSRAGGHGRASRQRSGPRRGRADGIFAARAGSDPAGGARGDPAGLPAGARGDLQVGACISR